MADRKKPRKPTSPYGYIKFAKDGRVSKHIFELSRDKETQERQVVESFASYFPNQQDHAEINSILDLPEADQDFLLTTSRGNITIQLTEIVEREYAFEITEEEYNSGKYHAFLAKKSEQLRSAP